MKPSIAVALVFAASCSGTEDAGSQDRAVGDAHATALDDSGARDDGAGTPTPPPTPEPLPMFALLVGVSDYPEGLPFPDLRGPGADVESMRELLTGRFELASDRVRAVEDGAATLEGIVRAIDEHLLQTTHAGDEALLYFSGHGSRVFDPSGHERGYHDSSLIAHDSRVGGSDGALDLTDDVLYSLLRPMAERGVHVTVITDACHSGGGVRGGFVERAVPGGAAGPADVESWPFWPAGVRFIDDADRDPGRELDNYVHVAACAPEQRAYEYCFADIGVRGLLTWALVDALRCAGARDTFEVVARRAAARIDAIPGAPAQSTWIEGPDAHRELFGSRYRPVPERFPLSDVGDGVHFRIPAGTVHGVAPGALLAVMDDTGIEIGRVVVESAGFASATASWTDATGLATGDRAMVAELVRPAADLPPLRVHSDDDGLIAACSDLHWGDVANESTRSYVLDIADDRSVVLRTAEGLPIWTGPPAETDAAGATGLRPHDLDVALRRESRFQALWRLASAEEAGPLGDLRVAFDAPTTAELRRTPADPDSPEIYAPADFERSTHGALDGRARSAPRVHASLPTLDSMQHHSSGIPLVIVEVTNETLETVYLHVLSLNEAREVSVLYPGPGVRDRPSTVDAPSTRVRVEVGAMSRDAFPPERPMRERYVVVAGESPMDLEWMRTGIDGQDRGSTVLPRILDLALGAGIPLRGDSTADRGEGWGVASIDVWIRRQ